MSHKNRAATRATLYSAALRQPYRQGLAATAALKIAQPAVPAATTDQAYLEGVSLTLIHDLQRSDSRFSDEKMLFTAIIAKPDSLELTVIAPDLVRMIETRVLALAHPHRQMSWSPLRGLRVNVNPGTGVLELTMLGVEGRLTFNFGDDPIACKQLAELRPRLARIMGPPADLPAAWGAEASAAIMSVVIRRLGVFDTMHPTYISAWARIEGKHVVEVGVQDGVSVDDANKTVARFCSPHLHPRVKIKLNPWRPPYQWDLGIEGTSHEIHLRFLGAEKR